MYINYVLLEKNISIIKSTFFEKYDNKEKISEFKELYAAHLKDNYVDILLIIKEFPAFNLFDYLNPDLNLQNMDEKTKAERRNAIIARNNIFLSLLIEAHSDKNEIIFKDLTFLRPHIETYKNILCDRDNTIPIEIDVDVFFLTFFSYKEKARSIIVKFYDYFKNFLKEFTQNDNQAKLIFENLDIIADKNFDDLNIEELIVLRKILNNCVKRKFLRGLEYLSQDEKFCCCMTEGRIWMNFMKTFPPNVVL